MRRPTSQHSCDPTTPMHLGSFCQHQTPERMLVRFSMTSCEVSSDPCAPSLWATLFPRREQKMQGVPDEP